MTDLVEREPALRSLKSLLDGARTQGHVVLVAGEAGIGKTSVLRAAAAAHRAAGGEVWWGACDALETPLPLAPLLDMARGAVQRFVAKLDGPRPALFEAVLDDLRLADGALLVIVEDAHWADDATLDLLKYLGRRIERTRALLAVSYRDDEVTAAHPLRRVLGELPPAARTYLPVPRLSAGAVKMLARQAGRSAEGLHALTHGNAFFVTELLRDDSAATTVPQSVQDVVLGRYARLPAGAQALLRLVAVMPGRTERWLVDELLHPALDHLESALASGLLLADAATLAYRHELGRVAVESSLSQPRAQALHRQVLAALQAGERATPAARLAHHALQAHDHAAITRWAPAAAEEASQRGAYREARAQWRAALRQGQPGDAAVERYWLEGFIGTGPFTGRDDDDMAAFRRLEQLALERSDPGDAAWQHARQGQACVPLLRHRDAELLVGKAVAMVQSLPPSLDKARVLHVAGWRLMIERDAAASMQAHRQALAIAESLRDAVLVRGIQSSIAITTLFIDFDDAMAQGEARIAEFRAEGKVSSVVTLLSNLGSGSGELMRLPRAEGFLREGMALCRTHEIDGQIDYIRAWLALCRMSRGDWDEAAALALEVTARAGALEMSRLMALLALGRLRVRRGDPGAAEALDEALALAAPSQTLQRIGPTHAARAEAAFMRGDLAAVRAEVEAGMPRAQSKGHPWFIGELAYWGRRAGVITETPPGAAEPYALALACLWAEAAAAWQALDCPYEQARALADGDEPAQRQALAIFERLGARPAAEALRRTLRDAGVRGLSRGARDSTRANPCQLTQAEMKTLALMAQGLRNADIAVRVHRSVRTVDHHVAAVLAKLGVDSRQAAVERATREGWLARE
jgi:DNA-binding CsgD family transcriptional regulator